jgi:integrase
MGLRVSEMVILTREDINLEKGAIKIYAPKTDTIRLMQIKFDRLRAVLMTYLTMDAPADGPILKASEYIPGPKASDNLTNRPMTRFDVFRVVKTMGKAIGISNLSPHDLRHTGATWIAETTRNIMILREWGGWRSFEVAGGYVISNKYANEDVNME